MCVRQGAIVSLWVCVCMYMCIAACRACGLSTRRRLLAPFFSATASCDLIVSPTHTHTDTPTHARTRTAAHSVLCGFSFYGAT